MSEAKCFVRNAQMAFFLERHSEQQTKPDEGRREGSMTVAIRKTSQLDCGRAPFLFGSQFSARNSRLKTCLPPGQ